jgi:hypothetical protein
MLRQSGPLLTNIPNTENIRRIKPSSASSLDSLTDSRILREDLTGEINLIQDDLERRVQRSSRSKRSGAHH